MGYPMQAVTSYDVELVGDPLKAFYDYLYYLEDSNEKFLGQNLHHWFDVLIDELYEHMPDEAVDEAIYMLDNLPPNRRAEHMLYMFQTMVVDRKLEEIFDDLIADMSVDELEEVGFVELTKVANYFPY